MTMNNADMTMQTKKTGGNTTRVKNDKTGFTLVELLVATSIAALISTLTWTILIETTKGNIRSEIRRRVHEDWNRATTLIQSEIAMSDLITSNNVSAENIPDEHCKLLQDSNARLKLRMHLVGTLPEIIYGTRTIESLPETEKHQWMGKSKDGVLIRCGPEREIGSGGKVQYRQGTYQQTIILDNLDLSSGDGLEIDPSTNSEKLVKFSLSMNENMDNKQKQTVRTKTLTSSGISRINDVQHIPSETSICQHICQVEDEKCGHGVKTLLSSDNRQYVTPNEAYVFGTKTVCTNRSLKIGDGIKGANSNYVLDGNPSPARDNPKGLTLEGGTGRNILLGTPVDDILKGGPDHDGLIGRGGEDKLYGFDGNDNIVPWPSPTNESEDVIVDGGDGFDRVYLNNPKFNYKYDNCNRTYCKVTSKSEGLLQLNNIEMLVFKESNLRL